MSRVFILSSFKAKISADCDGRCLAMIIMSAPEGGIFSVERKREGCAGLGGTRRGGGEKASDW